MDQKDRKLLYIIQSDFPLEERPYLALGQKLDLMEEEVIKRISKLKADLIIRQISAIFDTRVLGYKSSLVAMKIEPSILDKSAEIINSHPGVSHNYRRNHAYNLWFTVAVPPYSSLEKTVDKLAELTRADKAWLLPTLKLFKIGVRLDTTGENPPDAVVTDGFGYSEEQRLKANQNPLTLFEIQALGELQEDLAVEARPFDKMAAKIGVSTDELLECARGFISEGRMRRFAAILYHRKAGYKANAMGVWKVSSEKLDEAGTQMAQFEAVSHCYQRPVYPDWPYALFSMIHGQSMEACEKIADSISKKTGITDYALLYSTKEYKKTRVKYFTEEVDEWERKYLK